MEVVCYTEILCQSLPPLTIKGYIRVIEPVSAYQRMYIEQNLHRYSNVMKTVFSCELSVSNMKMVLQIRIHCKLLKSMLYLYSKRGSM